MKHFIILLLVALISLAVVLSLYRPDIIEDVWLWVIGLIGPIIGFTREGIKSVNNALAGTVRQKTIVKHLFDLPSLNKTLKHDHHIPIRRSSHLLNDSQVEEDMVFLQLCTEQRRFDSLFSSLKERTGIHNIDPILTQSQSMLIAYTQQSRRMASRIYQEVRSGIPILYPHGKECFPTHP